VRVDSRLPVRLGFSEYGILCVLRHPVFFSSLQLLDAVLQEVLGVGEELDDGYESVVSGLCKMKLAAVALDVHVCQLLWLLYFVRVPTWSAWIISTVFGRFETCKLIEHMASVHGDVAVDV